MTSRKIVSFDWAIKNILRDKANYDVLEGFLFALLKEKITIVELAESESNQQHAEMKFNRVDLLAVNESDEHIIIEVQYSPEQSFFKRLLYGTSKDIVDNMSSGKDYSHVKKVYSVSLIYFNVASHGAELDYVYHGKVDFTGLHNGKPVNIDKKFLIGYDDVSKEDINIFPEYFIIPIKVFDDVITDDLDQWIYAFKHNEVKAEFSAPGIDVMSKKLAVLNMPLREQKLYNKYLENLASDRGTLAFAKSKGRAEGKAEGKAEGMLEGLIKGKEEGIIEGEARGKEEGKAEGIIEGEARGKIETALNLKSLGVDYSVISQSTGLTVAEIEKL